MIPKDNESKLIEIFFYVSEKFEKELKFYCERLSNNKTLEFSDEEVMTVYLYIMQHEQ